MMHKTLDSIRLDYEKEMERLRHLQQERVKQEAIVKHFENNNEVYIKIRKTVEEKVVNILSDVKPLLRIAFLSITGILKYYQSFTDFRKKISEYFRTNRFNMNMKNYLVKSMSEYSC